jgi:hypothetical protein
MINVYLEVIENIAIFKGYFGHLRRSAGHPFEAILFHLVFE